MPKLKEPKKERVKLVMVKVPAKQLELMQHKAKKYAEGNLSAWIRYAATMLEPRPQDLEE